MAVRIEGGDGALFLFFADHAGDAGEGHWSRSTALSCGWRPQGALDSIVLSQGGPCRMREGLRCRGTLVSCAGAHAGQASRWPRSGRSAHIAADLGEIAGATRADPRNRIGIADQGVERVTKTRRRRGLSSMRSIRLVRISIIDRSGCRILQPVPLSQVRSSNKR